MNAYVHIGHSGGPFGDPDHIEAGLAQRPNGRAGDALIGQQLQVIRQR